MTELKEIYASEKEAKEAIDEFNQGKAKVDCKFYIAYKDLFLNANVYLIVDYEFFRNYQNMEREERRQRDIESRCLLHSQKYGFKKCMEDCNSCPYGKVRRDGKSLSLDWAYTNSKGEEYYLEIEDESSSIDEDEELLNQLLDTLDGEEDKYIMKMYREGYPDQEIADELGKPRRTITDRKNKIIKNLKNKSAKWLDIPPFEY